MFWVHCDFHWPMHLCICLLTMCNVLCIKICDILYTFIYHIYKSKLLALCLSAFDLPPDHGTPCTETDLTTKGKAKIFPACPPKKSHITVTHLYVHVKYKNSSWQRKMSIQMSHKWRPWLASGAQRLPCPAPTLFCVVQPLCMTEGKKIHELF